MRKANQLTKTLSILTLVFVSIAAISFAAFRETKQVCSEASKCSQPLPVPSSGGGEMIWDGFSGRLFSSVTIK